LDFLPFFFLLCEWIVSIDYREMFKVSGPYLLPAPQRLETVKESDILKQIGEQPKTRGNGKDSDAEQDQTEYRHGKEETK
jgi:hypothetical protein